jgi:hypothetical protein
MPGKKGPKGSKSEKLFCQFADATLLLSTRISLSDVPANRKLVIET